MQWQAAENDVLTCKTTWDINIRRVVLTAKHCFILQASGQTMGRKRGFSSRNLKPLLVISHYNCDASDP
jgi:hypothetical protein